MRLKLINWDEIKYALQNLMHRKLRSFLSIVSIMIGITAVFTLVSFGLGIQDYVNTLATQAGTDKLFIMAKSIGAPGTDTSFYLTQDDIDFVEKINGVQEISGMYMKPAEISFRDQKKYNYLAGIDMNNIDFILEASGDLNIEVGKQLRKGELGKVVLGYNYQVPDKIFARGIKVGDKVLVDSEQLEVIGFYEAVGNPSDDANIYVTKEQYELIDPSSKDRYGYVMIRAASDVSPKVLADRITEKLGKYKGQEEGKEDFTVQTFEDAIQTFNTVITIINGILVLIALISLVVASVNIMNTMYTAVLERTKEIGVMKAVGARNSDILIIFIFESGLLGVLGGIIGVGLGYLAATTGGSIAAAAGYSMLKPIFPLTLIIGCIFFAFLVGAGSGVLPAIRASKLHPVDSLRYE
ncbi:MAG TPA: ABC transporter permease [Candidatus Nanoarchaeia archaeon]|nr:ABC transporter permease [Candidatus Nanoarchaeia archaeon]